jgi:hypothetical protein
MPSTKALFAPAMNVDCVLAGSVALTRSAPAIEVRAAEASDGDSPCRNGAMLVA